MELIKPGTHIQFTRYRKIAIILSSAVNLAVLLLLFFKGPNLGVDFAGGTMVHLRFQQAVTIPDIRRALETIHLGGGVIQDFGERGGNEYLVRLDKTSVELGALSEQMKKSLTDKFGAGKFVGTPTYYIYDPKGEIVGQNIGPLTRAEVEEFIASFGKETQHGKQ